MPRECVRHRTGHGEYHPPPRLLSSQALTLAAKSGLQYVEVTAGIVSAARTSSSRRSSAMSCSFRFPRRGPQLHVAQQLSIAATII